MSHCYICDKTMDEVRLDARDMKPRPCAECELIIAEAVQALDTETNYNYIESELIDYREEVGTTDRETNLGDT